MAYTVYDAVVEVLDDLNYLNVAFENELISDASLARFISPKVAIKLGEIATIPTITTAVRRYLKTKPYKKTQSIELVKVLSSSKVFLQTGLAEMHALQSRENYEKISKLARDNGGNADKPFYVIPQASSLSVVSGEDLVQEITRTLGSNNLLKINGERALVTISYDPSRSFECPGCFHFYTSQFASLGVSILLAFSSYDRISFLVSEADSSRALKKITASLKEVSTAYKN